MARTPIHPGEHLAEALKELKISAAELAQQIDVPVNRATGIINGQRAIGRIVEISPGSVPIMPIPVPTDLDVDVRSVEMNALGLDRSSTSNCQRGNKAKRESAVDYSPHSHGEPPFVRSVH